MGEGPWSIPDAGAYGTTIERVLELLHEAGFEVELVTGIHDL